MLYNIYKNKCLLFFYGFTSLLQGKICLTKSKITAIVKNTSAKLNTGKLPRAIKSLTPPKNILSSRFPNVQAIKRLNSPSVKYFLEKRYPKRTTQINEIARVIIIGIPIPREIPVLKSGSKKGRFAQISWV
jgi:hypothetical protein